MDAIPSAVACLLLVATGSIHAANPVEVGTVRWSRDLDAALVTSGETGRPVFLLFQEVPGCAGCRSFGKTVLSHPLLVEAIEDEFLPVLVHNNTGGRDAEILERFGEPAWNDQIVRFLDAQAQDLLPRKDRVWTVGALASRMVASLRAAQRPVPRYLEAVAAEHRVSQRAECAFEMHCFWVGEAALGGVDGVLGTEAGWINGREVTRVVYDRSTVSLAALTAAARAARCADRVYVPAGEVVAGVTMETLDDRYRTAKASDQKKQLEAWAAVRRVPGLTDMQRTKINALAPRDRATALAWLSPRQRRALAALEAPVTPVGPGDAPAP